MESVTDWIAGWKRGNEYAAIELGRRYRPLAERVARRKLSTDARHKTVADEEDVAVEALNNLLSKIRDGNFPDLKNRGDFARVLAAFATNVALNHSTSSRSAKRNASKTVHLGDLEASGSADKSSETRMYAQNFDTAYTELREEIISTLADDQLKMVFKLLMDGQDTEVISKKLNVSYTTASRRVSMVRAACLEVLTGKKS
jgi:DNA-directed RNA polymerase specialized sigma24 family protein